MTKEQLRQHRRDIQDIRIEMRQLINITNEMRDRATRVTASYSNEPRGGGLTHDPIAEVVARVADKDAGIAMLGLQLDVMADEIERAIRPLAPVSRYVFRAYYVEGMTWEQVAEVSNYSLRQVHKIHGKGLEAIARKECIVLHTSPA